MVEVGVEFVIIVVIGDISFDIVMVLNVGLCVVGVVWGYYEIVDLVWVGVYVIVWRFVDLIGLLEDV